MKASSGTSWTRTPTKRPSPRRFCMIAPFAARHIGPREEETQAMLAAVGASSLDALIDEAVPKSIRFAGPLTLPEAASEAEAIEELGLRLRENRVAKSFIGAGYHGCHVPPVIQRNMFENPAWYTAYTPYQSEIRSEEHTSELQSREK